MLRLRVYFLNRRRVISRVFPVPVQCTRRNENLVSVHYPVPLFGVRNIPPRVGPIATGRSIVCRVESLRVTITSKYL